VVVFAPGFQIPPDQYLNYAQALAGFGYVAIIAGYPQNLFAPNHVAAAEDLSAALDWAMASTTDSTSPLFGLVSTTAAGVSGHSLGGKLAILAAAADSRFQASITLDAVDGSMDCSAQQCPNAIDALPLPIPTGFLGETLDSSGGILGMSCAPADENYDTLYQKASSPSLEVTVLGASHMSFVSDPATCGLVCSVCQAPTAPQAQVLSLAQAYLVAFYERYLRGNTGYDTYLDGAAAQSAYVATQQATLLSK
jgi:predicted dienelactone hydrolase